MHRNRLAKLQPVSQPRGSLPVGPLVIMIHMACVWVPFTSESKEAIADYDEIRKEMKLALMECGRKLGTYLRKRQKMQREAARRDVFERYIGEISKAVNAINGTDAKKLYDALLKEAQQAHRDRRRAAGRGRQDDQEGRDRGAEERRGRRDGRDPAPRISQKRKLTTADVSGIGEVR